MIVTNVCKEILCNLLEIYCVPTLLGFVLTNAQDCVLHKEVYLAHIQVALSLL